MLLVSTAPYCKDMAKVVVYDQQTGQLNTPSESLDVDLAVVLIHNGTISYPYRRFYLPSPEELYKLLKESVAAITKTNERVTKEGLQSSVDVPEEIPVYRGNNTGEALTDYYTEPERCRASVAVSIYSQYQMWMQLTREILLSCMTNYPIVNTYSLRQTIRVIGATSRIDVPLVGVRKEISVNMKMALETNNFSSHSAAAIYNDYCPEDSIVLDPSAGWGDRMQGAAASSKVRKYIGIDPNEDLYTGYSQIAELVKDDLIVEILPHGSEVLPYTDKESVDLVFTSPPYWDLEIYNKSSSQSVSLFSSYESWLNGFLYETIDRTYYRLKKNRYYILHIRDIRGADLVAPLMKKFEQIGAEYVGVIGMSQNVNVAPLWIWRKP